MIITHLLYNTQECIIHWACFLLCVIWLLCAFPIFLWDNMMTVKIKINVLFFQSAYLSHFLTVAHKQLLQHCYFFQINTIICIVVNPSAGRFFSPTSFCCLQIGFELWAAGSPTVHVFPPSRWHREEAQTSAWIYLCIWQGEQKPWNNKVQYLFKGQWARNPCHYCLSVTRLHTITVAAVIIQQKTMHLCVWYNPK